MGICKTHSSIIGICFIFDTMLPHLIHQLNIKFHGVVGVQISSYHYKMKFFIFETYKLGSHHDFGDGTCDTLVEVTKDGEVETVDLRDLQRGDRFMNILKVKKK